MAVGIQAVFQAFFNAFNHHSPFRQVPVSSQFYVQEEHKVAKAFLRSNRW